jgi:hypothetical protein
LDESEQTGRRRGRVKRVVFVKFCKIGHEYFRVTFSPARWAKLPYAIGWRFTARLWSE